MNDLLAEFVVETRETLERVGETLVAWEADPADLTRIDEVFRFVHTVKGSCGFLDLPRIAALAHAAESALAEVREGKRPASPGLVGAMLGLIDRIALLSQAIESGASVPDEGDDIALIAAIECDAPVAVAAAARSQDRGHAVRVDVALLETMMNQVSDLVLAHNDLARRLGSGDCGERALDDLRSLIGELRGSITRTRMQPIERLFARLPRLVRDVAAASGKQVRLDIVGGEVEIDREMADEIRDPLLHIVRNAIDHGIEAPAARIAAGKPPAGTLRITARQSGNQVSIEVTDDGGGVDLVTLKARAVRAGVVRADVDLSDESTLELIFTPGLSTAREITEISGRGVGMDVVRDNVERLGGAVALLNRPGKGLSITLRAPLTLTIVNAIIVEAGGHRFAVPRAAVEEIIASGSAALRLEMLGDVQVALIRDTLIDMISLGSLLELKAGPQQHVIVLETPGAARFVLGVDRVCGDEELVVRPLAQQLLATRLYAGCALSASGEPLLVIDPAAMAQRAGLERRGGGVLQPAAATIGRSPSMLTFRGLDGVRRAARLVTIGRIEEVDREAFASAGGRDFVRLDGNLHPARIDGHLPDSGSIVLMRLKTPEGPVGYPVAEIFDLAPIGAVTTVTDPGIEGLTLHEGRPIPLILPTLAHRPRRRRVA